CESAIISCFFFFSSRRRHTRFSRDWSSDVCSSDLPEKGINHERRCRQEGGGTRSPTGTACQGRGGAAARDRSLFGAVLQRGELRSEERRVGKGCRGRWWACREEKKGSEGDDKNERQ